MSTNEEKNSKGQLHYERPPSIIERKLPDPIAEEAEDKKHQKKHRSLQYWFNLCLVIFTAVTASVAWWQGSLTRQSIEVATRQAKASEDANKLARDIFEANQSENKVARKESNRQSKAALSASIQASRTDQRAWLSVGKIPNTLIAFEPNKLLLAFVRLCLQPLHKRLDTILIQHGRGT